MSHKTFSVSEAEWRIILGLDLDQSVDWGVFDLELGELYEFQTFWGYGVAFFGDADTAIRTLLRCPSWIDTSCYEEGEAALQRAEELFDSKFKSRPPAPFDSRWLLFIFNP